MNSTRFFALPPARSRITLIPTLTLVPTLCVGMPAGRSSVLSDQRPSFATQSVEDGIPTQSVGTRSTRSSLGGKSKLGTRAYRSAIGRFLLLFGICSTLAIPARAAEFELKDGDKVVWLGSTLIEREQRFGYWETALTARWPDRKIRFRNLGWSGDNVFGEARLSFDINKPELGSKRMVDLTLAEKPTVIFVCFGTNESFDGEAGLQKFEKGYEQLLDQLKPAKARIVLMTPIPFIACDRSVPDPKEQNQRLGLYVAKIKKIAQKRGLACADLFAALATTNSSENLRDCTDNGIHLNEEGYRKTSDLLCRLLIAKRDYPATIDLKAFGRLRQAIIEKNRLYFYRWRPENETYLFGSRKHEQGRNAKEIAAFDPLIAKAEEEIDKLKKPKTRQDEPAAADKN